MRGREPLCIGLLPLYVILIFTLLIQIEYRDKTWKQILSSPQEKINLFLAKFITLQLMVVAFIVGYNFFLIITGIAAEIVHPWLYDGKIELNKILSANAQVYLLILGVSAIQFRLSLRFNNFIAPLAIGFGLWFLAPMMVFEFKTTFVEQFPYAFTMLSVMPKYKVNVITYQRYSILTAILFLTLGFFDFRSRKIKT